MTLTEEARPLKAGDIRHHAAAARRVAVLENLEAGMPVRQAWSEAGMSENSYKRARTIHRDWAARIDALTDTRHVKGWDGSLAQFFAKYFGHKPSWFHLLYLEELAKMPPGNILVAIFPPEHGKTTMFEDYANMTLALDPEHRFIVAGAGQGLAKKMLSRVKSRMEPMGPSPQYVRDFGPFEPQVGQGRQASQPWSTTHFNVYGKRHSDERDYSFLALGVGSEIIGSRCDHLHIDDPQSLKTLGKKKVRSEDTVKTEDIAAWFHQDALSRPGEMGKTTVNGTIVGKGGFLQYLQRQTALVDAGILKILKFPVIVTDPVTKKPTPLWRERYTMEQLDRMRLKAGVDETSWNTQYMMNPEANDKTGHRTFRDISKLALDAHRSFDDLCDPGSVCYITVDPALGGRNVVMVVQLVAATPPLLPQLIVRYIADTDRTFRNEDIIDEIVKAVHFVERGGASVSDVIIESMNFQRGLARDTRLVEESWRYGFQLREHLTGNNKIDADIGVPSMARGFMKRQIVIPYKDDKNHGGTTRYQADEIIRQLDAWEPGQKGVDLVQDQVMALWFAWITWEQRWKSATPAPGSSSATPDAWKRTGLTYAQSITDALVIAGNRSPI